MMTNSTMVCQICKLLNVKLLFFVVICVYLLACSTRESISEQPYKYNDLLNVEVTLKTKSLKHIEIQGDKFTFLYFDYLINNQSPKTIYFDPSLIRVTTNNLTNSDTTYDSIVSQMPEEIKLKTGENKFNLYAIFNGYELKSPIKSLEFVNAGILMEAFSP